MKAKRISKGHYLYRGFKITCYPNEAYRISSWRRVWEAVDENGCGFAHSSSLRDTKRLIDEDLESGRRCKL